MVERKSVARGKKRSPGLLEGTKGYRVEGRSASIRLRGPSGPKQAVNVSIDAEILSVAKDLKINLSQTLEDAVRQLTQEVREKKWQDENRRSIESYNRLIERAGVAGEEFQDWDEPEV